MVDTQVGGSLSPRRVGMLVALVLLLGHSWMWPSQTLPNERSRIYLTVALVDHGTLAIDEPMRRFGRIGDRAKFDGRAISDKAPGSSLLAAVPYAAVRLFTAPEDWTIASLIELVRRTVMLPLGLLGFVAVRRVLLLLFDDEDHADLGAVGWLLATTAFHYTGAFYGHQIIAVMLIVALWQLLEAERNEARWWRFAVAGGCAGIAGLTEYQAGGPCLMLLVWVLASPTRNLRRIAAFGLPAAAAVGGLMAYNQAAFGGPFELSYNHLALSKFAALHSEGVGGVGLPDLTRLKPMLLSVSRGLLITSPIFALTVPGGVMLWRRGDRRLAALVLGSTAYYLLVISGAQAWYGGWSFGLRLMVPSFPWMLIGAMAPMAIYRDRAWPELTTRALFAVGLFYQQAVHAVLPEMPSTVRNPLVDVVLPSLQQRMFVPNLVVELTGVDDSLWVLLPLALLVAGWLWWISTPRGPWTLGPDGRPTARSRRSGYAAAALAVGILLVIVSAHGRRLTDEQRGDLMDLVERQRTRVREWRQADDAG